MTWTEKIKNAQRENNASALLLNEASKYKLYSTDVDAAVNFSTCIYNKDWLVAFIIAEALDEGTNTVNIISVSS